MSKWIVISFCTYYIIVPGFEYVEL